MAFTTDTILRNLYRRLADHPEDDGPAATDGNIRLAQHHEISAYISLYREEGKLWAQLRIGYIYKPYPANPCARRKDFRKFMDQRKHNPLRLFSGQNIDLSHCFVNDAADENHRWGLDVIVDDCGFEMCAELFDYLLVTAY